MEVKEGTHEELNLIIRKKIELTAEEIQSLAEEHNITDVNVLNLTQIKNQVLAYKAINYVCYTKNQIRPNKISFFRTNWKKANAPHQVRKVSYKQNTAKTEVASQVPLPKDDFDEEQSLFNYDLIAHRQQLVITRLEDKEAHLKAKIKEFSAELEEVTGKLEHYKAIRAGTYIPPSEHTAGGGVDQGEREYDEL